MRALRRRYGRARTPREEVDRWSANSRKWWARAEREAPKELRAYRNAKGSARRVALGKLKEALR